MHFTSEKIIQALCWTLLHSLWQGLIAAFVAAGVLILSRKSNARLRYNMLTSILLLFVIIVAVTFYQQLNSSSNSITSSQFSREPAHTGSDAHKVPLATAENSIQSYLNSVTIYFNAHAGLVVIVWFIVLMIRCINILSGLITVQRMLHYRTRSVSKYWQARMNALSVQLKIRRFVTLLESGLVKVPVVIGILKPVILVPIGMLNQLAPEQVESILLHELAHIMRHDYVFNLLQRIVDVLFFFNPASLWISALIRNERENCCDDIAICETKNKKQFVQALVSFYEYNRTAHSVALHFTGSRHRLVDRVKRIATDSNRMPDIGERIVLITALLLFATAWVNIGTRRETYVEKYSSYTDTNKNRHSVLPAPLRILNSKTSARNSLSQRPGKLIFHQAHTADEKQSGDKNGKVGIQDIVPGSEAKSPDKIDDSFTASMDAIGFSNINSQKLKDVRDHGVTAEFINEFYQLGYKPFSLDKAIELRDHGVNSAFIVSLNREGFNNISLDQAIDLRDHGVDASYINGFKQLGYVDLTLPRVQQLRDHGVSVSFALELKGVGFTEISLDKMQELLDHGVNASYVSSFKESGFKIISPELAISLKDHGIDEAFVEKWKNKVGADRGLDEYIILKDQL